DRRAIDTDYFVAPTPPSPEGGREIQLLRLEAMAEARQLVKYTFVKVDPRALSWAANERQAAVREFAGLLDAGADAGTLLTYSTVGLRGDCDVLIWQAADTV